MTVEDIAFIVPSKDAQHVLYLKDGRIITIGTYDGTPYNVGRLPTAEAIAGVERTDLEARARTQGKRDQQW